VVFEREDNLVNRRIILFLLIALVLSSGYLAAAETVKKPIRAMLYSALLPGGGQFYNEAYVKTGIVAGLQAMLISSAVYDNNKISHYQDLMDTYSQDEINYQVYKEKRNSYRAELRSDYWWIGTVLALSVADAFVDAHLYNFKAEKSRILLRFSDKQVSLGIEF
jgi:hypothetical protein